MIITRTPLRISLGGGGTDLPSYYEPYGGFVLAGAINRYVYICINRTFTDDYFLKYSGIERVREIDRIDHPIFREALRLHGLEPGIEIVSVADIPSGTGLGSSGSFTVGLLRALYAHERKHTTSMNIAAEACKIEMELLQRPVGKQDQHIAAFGGLTCFEFAKDGRIQASRLTMSNDALCDLEEHLLMFFTGYAREADTVLAEQRTRSSQGDPAMVDNLHLVKELGLASKDALQRGDTQEFARLMDVHWQNKKKRSAIMSNSKIDDWYQLGLENGALGGKLVGAGAGGFLLFYAQDRDRLRKALQGEGLTEVRFQFDHDGSTVLVRD